MPAFEVLRHLIPNMSHIISMAKSTPISAFYEPGAPPPSLSVLTFQTEFVPSPDNSPTILTQDIPLSANKWPPSRPPSWNECDNPLRACSDGIEPSRFKQIVKVQKFLPMCWWAEFVILLLILWHRVSCTDHGRYDQGSSSFICGI